MLKSILSTNAGRVYVYLATDEVCKQFLKDAENEGFTFSDGTKPTQKHASDILAINPDFTINYVGTIGHIAYQAASKIGNQKLIRIDYRDFLIDQSEK